MRRLSHIERSTFRKGEYIAYYRGVQRIRRCDGGWRTYAQGTDFDPWKNASYEPMFARTLCRMDDIIEEKLQTTNEK